MRELPLKRTALGVSILCLVVLPAALAVKYFAGGGIGMGLSSGADYPIKRLIQYSYTLHNDTNHLLRNAEFWTYAPVRRTATQRCDRLGTSHPYDLTVDGLGNQILHFVFDGIAPYGSKVISIRAELAMSDTPNRLPEQSPEAFLRPEKYIEADAPEIVEAAGKLKVSRTDGTARGTFRWVAENLRYSGYQRDERGALHALRNRAGDCTEYALLFTALCRAGRIPARGMAGYVCREDCILSPAQFHNWAEFFDGNTWWMADPQKGAFKLNPSRYVAMQVLGASAGSPMEKYHRFRCSGEGLRAKMN